MTIEPCQPRHSPIPIEAVAHLPTVMLPEMYAGSFFQSAIAAKGIPQLATGPQKCYRTREWLFNMRGMLLRGGYHSRGRYTHGATVIGEKNKGEMGWMTGWSMPLTEATSWSSCGTPWKWSFERVCWPRILMLGTCWENVGNIGDRRRSWIYKISGGLLEESGEKLKPLGAGVSELINDWWRRHDQRIPNISARGLSMDADHYAQRLLYLFSLSFVPKCSWWSSFTTLFHP